MDMLGSRVLPLHVGPGAEPRDGESLVDDGYLERLRGLPRLEIQGDGMKSFVGIIINVLFGNYDAIFLDEPEAFLHPPQARLLANILSTERPSNTQLLVATHSVDFVRGALECNDDQLRVARISRERNAASITELAQEDIEKSWSDPVLRFSNVIDGLFHEKVIVCEADGDCRFYAAIAEALRRPDDHPYWRDTLFVQSGGKGGISKLIDALRALSVPVAAVVDFDIFRQLGQLNALIASLGADPKQFQEAITAVRNDILSISPSVKVSEVKASINAILSEIDDEAEEIPRSYEKKLRDAIKSPPGWARAKTTGLGILQRNIRSLGDDLLRRFEAVGLFVVPVGEIESFEPSETATKNAWVHATLETHKDDIAICHSLADARAFVSRLITAPNGTPLPENPAAEIAASDVLDAKHISQGLLTFKN